MRESERTLRSEHDTLRRLVDRAPLGIYLVDAEFRIAHVNPVALPVFGDIPGGVTGRDFGDVIRVLWPRKYADEIVGIFRRTLETGESYVVPERSQLRIDRGVVEFYDWRVDRLTLPDGRHGVVCYFRNIGDEVAAREKLAAAESASRQRAEWLARLHALGESCASPDAETNDCLEQALALALAITGANKGNVQLYDEADGTLKIVAQTGFSPRFLEFFRTVTDDDAAACGAAFRSRERVTVDDVTTDPIFAGTEAGDVLVADGVWAVQSTPLRSGSGRIVGMLSTHFENRGHRLTERQCAYLDLLVRQMADFVERQRSAQAVKDSTEQLRIVTETMAALVTRCSRDLKYVWVSKPYAEWLHRGVGDIVGRPIVDVLGQDAFEQLRPYFDRVLSGEVVRYEEQIEVREVGFRWIVATYVPTFDASGQCDGWVAALTDIDERRRMEEALRHAREDAERANRAKDDFLATVSHELRSPLQGILGWLSLLKQGRLDPAQTARAFESIERSVRLQAELVHDLVDVSRIAGGKVELVRVPLDVAAMAHSTAEEFMPAAVSHDLELRVVGDDAGIVLADRERIHQVIANLLSNAVKFTPRGGRIVVSCRRDRGHSVVAVTDTGQGIAKGFLPHLFERFTQADASSTRRHGGLGLGLAIVKNLVELHGGTVTAHSEGVGHGASFELRLPEATAQTESQGEAMTAPSVTRLDGVDVLLVEDDRDAREALTMMLRHTGATVRAAASAREALRALADRHPNIVVSDLSMPDEDGFSLLRRIRALDGNGSVPAVALTGYTRAEDRTRALAAGFAAHLAKPVDADALLEVIAKLIVRERTAGPS